MHRRRFLWILAALTLSCGRHELTREQVLPVTVGSWRLESSSEPPPGEAPDPLPSLGVERVFEGTYTGAGTIRARVYQMKSQAGGLDAIQRWRPVPDTVTFHDEEFFATVQWENVERAALAEFVRALEAHVREIR